MVFNRTIRRNDLQLLRLTALRNNTMATPPDEQRIFQSLAKYSWSYCALRTYLGNKNKYTPITVTYSCFIFLSFLLIACAPVISIAEQNPVLIINSGDRRDVPGPSFPMYQFKIYEDGLVIYNGELKVNVIGERRAKIAPSQVQELINIFMKIYNRFDHYEMFGKNKHYLMRSDPFSIQLDYQGKKLQFKPGSFADYLLADLNKSTPIENWICPPPNSSSHPEYDVYCRSFKHAVSIQEYIDKHP